MRVQAIHHVQVAAPPGSEGAARAFYGEVLGLEEVPKPPHLAARGGVWFRCGDLELHVGVEEAFHPARKAHVAFRVTGIEAWRRRVASAGAPVREDAPLPGYRRFYTEDPFGNRVELLEPEG